MKEIRRITMSGIRLIKVKPPTGASIRNVQHTDQSAGFIPPDARWYATTGSFRKMYSPSGSGATDYAEMAGYSPSEIGFVKVIVEDKQIIDVQKTVV